VRLWSLHPKYLDARGLTAVWREALLAQAVLRGRTRGYKHHPQLQRFAESAAPRAAIARYLRALQAEAAARGYQFDASRIGRGGRSGSTTLAVTQGQLSYEWQHLRHKLRGRAPAWLRRLPAISVPHAHPMFRVLRGGIASWEISAAD
jgi:Pyrimidine dimer DNA glycosylase